MRLRSASRIALAGAILATIAGAPRTAWAGAPPSEADRRVAHAVGPRDGARADRAAPRATLRFVDGGHYGSYSALPGVLWSRTLHVTGGPDAPLRFQVRDLPTGANVEYIPDGLTIRWTPTPDDIGQHSVAVVATRGEESATERMIVGVNQEWEAFFLPGLKTSSYVPNDGGTYGAFHGIAVDFSIISWIHMNEHRGPSHGRVYLSLDMLGSTRSGVGAAFIPATGFELSIERNPRRRFLIPVFGLEAGGIFQREIDRVFFLQPQGGIHLYASPNAFVSGTLGAAIAVDGQRVDTLTGLRGRLGLSFAIW